MLTLKQHHDIIKLLMEVQGEDAPVAAWILTKSDVYSLDENMNQTEFPVEDAKEILDEIHENSYIRTTIFSVLDSFIVDKEKERC